MKTLQESILSSTGTGAGAIHNYMQKELGCKSDDYYIMDNDKTVILYRTKNNSLTIDKDFPEYIKFYEIFPLFKFTLFIEDLEKAKKVLPTKLGGNYTSMGNYLKIEYSDCKIEQGDLPFTIIGDVKFDNCTINLKTLPEITGTVKFRKNCTIKCRPNYLPNGLKKIEFD